jgi:two-component system chemotaxis response regulator CheB
MQNSNSLELKKVVLIGASTGGPGEIEKIVKSLISLHQTAFVIAQHMSKEFMPSFIKRLSSYTQNQIFLTEDETQLKSGNIYFCRDLSSIQKRYGKLVFHVNSSHPSIYNPNINFLFNSFVSYASEMELFCIVLTGIGDDGVAGCSNLRMRGVRCATQSKNCAIVDGMPSRVRAIVKDIEIYDSTQEIIQEIERFCS